MQWHNCFNDQCMPYLPPRCMSVMEQGTQCMVVIVEIAAHTARWWSRGHLTITTPVTTFRYFTGGT